MMGEHVHKTAMEPSENSLMSHLNWKQTRGPSTSQTDSRANRSASLRMTIHKHSEELGHALFHHHYSILNPRGADLFLQKLQRFFDRLV